MRRYAHIFVKFGMFLGFLLFAGFLVAFKITFVSGQSMEPTLRDKQVMLVKKTGNTYLQNDIITFHNVQYGDCVKRIIGKEGDTIELKDGKLYRNGIELSNYTCEEGIEKVYPLKANEFFVIGDNFAASKDSRNYGPISIDDVIGKVVLY